MGFVTPCDTKTFTTSHVCDVLFQWCNIDNSEI